MESTKFEDVTKEVMNAIGEGHNLCWYRNWLRNMKRASDCCTVTREPKVDATVDPEVCGMVVGEKYAQECAKTIAIFREHNFTLAEAQRVADCVLEEVEKMYL